MNKSIFGFPIDGGPHPGPAPVQRFSAPNPYLGCEHVRQRFVYRVQQNGTMYGYECLHCGGLNHRPFVGASRCAEVHQEAPESAVPLGDAVTQCITQARAVFYNARFRDRTEWYGGRRDEWFAWYDRYLASSEWKARRQQVFERDGFVCQMCEQRPAEQCHHKTYDRVGYEPLEDLISVCEGCHKNLHGEWA